jgi:hypothetical protein
MIRGASFLGSSGQDFEWCYLKNRVWQAATRGCPNKRFLCVLCTERRLDRKLTAKDFRRNAKVNFTPKSPRLKRRIAGLVPAKRLVETTFTF